MTTEARTPNSVKLSSKHREQTVTNIIEAWEKKNPAPAQPGIGPLLLMVARECKKHSAFKRTGRLKEAVEPRDWETDDLFRIGFKVLVRTVDEEGNEKAVTAHIIPRSIADEVGLPYRRVQSIYPRHKGVDANQWDYPSADHDKDDAGSIFAVNYIGKDTPMVQIVETSAAYGRYKKAREARKAWEQERDRLRSEATDALEQFNTTKQLREHWPEIVDFLPAHVADPTRAIQLPTVSVSKLNERLGFKSVRKGE